MPTFRELLEEQRRKRELESRSLTPINRSNFDEGDRTEEEEVAGGLDLLSFPTGKPPTSLPTSATRNQTQFRQRAETEVSNALVSGGPEFRSQFERELSLEKNPEQSLQGLATEGGLLQGAMDLIGATNFAAAGFAQELARTGDYGTAFDQMVLEWANAMPGYANPRARRPTFSDALRESDVVKDMFEGDLTAPAPKVIIPIVGFMLDVLLDPLTYLTAGGTVFAKGVQGLSTVGRAKRIGLNVLNPGLGALVEGAGLARRSGGAVKGLSILESAGVKFAGTAGEAVLPHFRLRQLGDRTVKKVEAIRTALSAEGEPLARQIAKDDDLVDRVLANIKDKDSIPLEEQIKEEIETFIGFKRTARVEQAELLEEMQVEVMKIHGGLDEVQIATLGLFHQQPTDVIQQQYKMYLSSIGQEVTPDDMARLMAGQKQFSELYAKWGQEAVDNKLIDIDALNAMMGYAPGRWPQGKISQADWDRFASGRGIAPQLFEQFTGKPLKSIRASEIYEEAKLYPTVLDRVLAGFPTELNASKQAAARGMERARSISSINLIKSVYSDSNLIRMLDAEKGLADLTKKSFQDKIAQSGRVFYDPRDMKQIAPSKITQKDLDLGIYAFPEEMANELTRMRMSFDGDDLTKGFWGAFNGVQNVWKAYALMSPGYHFRNMYSNIFQNWLAGVNNPKAYAEALVISHGGTQNLGMFRRATVEGILGGPVGLDDVMVKHGKGRTDDVLQELGGNLPKESWTVRDLQKITKEDGVIGSGLFDRDIGTRIDDAFLAKLDRNAIKSASVNVKLEASREISSQLQAAGTDPEMAEAVSLMMNARAISWSATHDLADANQYLRSKHAGISGDMNSFGPNANYQVGYAPTETVRLPGYTEPPVLFGDMEEAMHPLFSKSKIPKSFQLKAAYDNNANWSSIYPDPSKVRDVSEIDYHIDSIADWAGDEVFAWKRQYANEVSRIVGTQNADEFMAISEIVGIGKPIEQASAETFQVMRVLRKHVDDGGSIESLSGADLKKLLQEDPGAVRTLRGDITRQTTERGNKLWDVDIDGTRRTMVESQNATTIDTREAESILSYLSTGQIPGTRAIADLFNFEGTLSPLQNRYSDFIISELAVRKNKTPDEINAAVQWWHKARFSPGTTDFGSGYPYSTNPVGRNEIFRSGDLSGAQKVTQPQTYRMGSWQSSELFSRPESQLYTGAYGTSAPSLVKIKTPQGVAQTAKEYTESRIKIPLTQGMFRVGSRLSTEEEGLLYEALMGRITSGAPNQIGTKLRGLEDLEKLYNFQHTISSTRVSSAGEFSPSIEIVVNTSDDSMVNTISAVMGDLLGMDDVTWYRPRSIPTTDAPDAFLEAAQKTGVLVSGLTPEQQAAYASRFQGLDVYLHSADDNSIRIINEGMGNNDFYDKFALQPGEMNVFNVIGGNVNARNYTAAVGQAGNQAITAGSSNIQRRLQNTLYEPTDSVFREFAPSVGDGSGGTGVYNTGIATRLEGRGVNIFEGPLPENIRGGTYSINPDVRELNPGAKADRGGMAGTFTRRQFKWNSGDRIIDLGGGASDKATDHMLQAHNAHLQVLDPYNRSAFHNRKVRNEMLKRPADVGTLNNVLDVIDAEDVRHDVLLNLARYTKPGGDVRIESKQAHTLLKEVKRIFPDADAAGDYITATNTRKSPSYYQKGDGVIKGAAQLEDDGRVLLGLFETADASTVIHEMGHWLRLTDSIPTKELGSIASWLGGPKFKLSDINLKHEEKIAEAFEAYVMEGIAPTPSLNQAFATMKNQMEVLYQHVKKLEDGTISTVTELPDRGFQINNQVRKVFDRVFQPLTQQEVLQDAVAAQQGLSLRAQVGHTAARYLGPNGSLPMLNRKIGASFEDNARLAHYLTKLRKTGDQQTSARSVFKYLFDYDELTDFERKFMKSLLPFYSWSRKNIPLQMTALLEDPGKYSRVFKLINEIEEITPEWDNLETPDYFDDVNAFRIPVMLNEQPVYLNVQLPYQSLNDANSDGLLQNMTPFVKVFSEWFPKDPQSLFTGRAIAAFQGEPAKVLPGVSRVTEHNISTFATPIGKFLRGVEKTQRTGSVLPSLISELGAGVVPLDAEKVDIQNAAVALAVKRRLERKLRALERREEKTKLTKRTTRTKKTRRGNRAGQNRGFGGTP